MTESLSREARRDQRDRSVMSAAFDYNAAFSRNIGWVTEAEQAVLRTKRVSIAGLGGVGGVHLLTLARLGVGAFTLAEFDTFDLANFNRQVGATMSTLGRPKLDVLIEVARDINPELDIRTLGGGVTSTNVDEFLEDADIYVDGLDFFAFEARQTTFGACARLGLPAVTAAPIGMGVALLNFMPGRMTFEEYFRLEGQSEAEQALRFLVGLSPAMLHRGYLVDRSRVDFAARRGPSTAMACQLCAGVAATETLKILLKRGRVIAAPRGVHFDAYRNKLTRTWRPGGNRNPLQQLALTVARRQFSTASTAPATAGEHSTHLRPIEAILDLARWAPSGDNTQPWRFEILSDDHVVVHGFDTRDHCIYDIDGRPSQLSLGALLESIKIAASAHGLAAAMQLRLGGDDRTPKFDVRLKPDRDVRADPLVSFIRTRSVHRRPLSARALTPNEKTSLEQAPCPGYSLEWQANWPARLAMARLLSVTGKLRLVLPEAYEVHRNVIAWGTRYSDDKIPDAAVGLDPVSTRLMRWAMGSWGRVEFLNKYLAGTAIPRLELDFLPAVLCAAHFLVLADRAPVTLEDYVSAGRAVQRLWLTCTALGLQLQPEITPLVFYRYVRGGQRFTRASGAWRLAQSVAQRLGHVWGEETLARAVFMGRVGAGGSASARSGRRALSTLLIDTSANA